MIFFFIPSIVIAVAFLMALALGINIVEGIVAIAPIFIVLFVILIIVAIARASVDFSPFFGFLLLFLLLCAAIYLVFRYPVILPIAVVMLLLYAFAEDIVGLLSVWNCAKIILI